MLNNHEKNTATSKSTSRKANLNLNWLKFGIPIAFGLLAASLNSLSVQRQITPVTTFAFAKNLPAGTLLKPTDLVAVQVGGSFDRSQLVRETDLRQKSNSGELYSNLTLGLTQSPRILSRSVRKGELVTRGSFGGSFAVSDANSIGEIWVSRKSLQGNGRNLVQGQRIRITAFPHQKFADAKSESLGPFIVAPFDPGFDPDANFESAEEIKLLYPIGRSEQTTSSNELREELQHPKYVQRLLNFISDETHILTVTVDNSSSKATRVDVAAN